MGSMVSPLEIENTDVQPLVPRFRVIFKYLMMSKYQKIRIERSLFSPAHLRSDELSIPAPIHPEHASHEGCLNVGQCSWEGCQGSPGCRSREEGDNRRSAA